MDAAKQYLLIQRMLFLFNIRRKQVRHVTNARLTLETFEQTVDSCCLLAYILQEMSTAEGPNGGELFSDDSIAKARQRAVEGYLGKPYGLLRLL